jgi:hypothetical protein
LQGNQDYRTNKQPKLKLKNKKTEAEKKRGWLVLQFDPSKTNK